DLTARATIHNSLPLHDALPIWGTDAGLLEDGRRGARRSDTMMLASYDPLTGGLSILSIPRDTYVEIPLDRLDEQLHRYIRENPRSEEHTSELQSRENLVCRLLL